VKKPLPDLADNFNALRLQLYTPGISPRGK
jgi:hypothetical protein